MFEPSNSVISLGLPDLRRDKLLTQRGSNKKRFDQCSNLQLL